MNTSVAMIVTTILSQTLPTNDGRITHPGNWPVDAEFGVEVEALGVTEVKYFSDVDSLSAYCEHIQEKALVSHWVKVYQWDWGPEFVREFSVVFN